MNKRPVFIIIVFVGLLLFFVSFGFVFVLNGISGKVRSVEKKYQLVEFDDLDGSRKYSTVLSENSLPSKGYLSLKYPGKTSILTPFESSCCECKGSCYCETENRRMSTVLSTGVPLVLSAMSVFMASKIAREVMQNHCEETFSKDECSGAVFAGIEGCGCGCDHSQSNSFSDEDGIPEGGYFHCRGNCVDNHMSVGNSYRQRCQEKYGMCNDLYTEADVYISEMGLIASREHNPEMQFLESHLVPFCNSEYKVLDNEYGKLEGVVDGIVEESFDEHNREAFKTSFIDMFKTNGYPCCHAVNPFNRNTFKKITELRMDEVDFSHVKCEKVVDGGS